MLSFAGAQDLDPFRLLLIAVAGWMNHEPQKVTDYLREENRVLRAQISRRRLRFDDDGLMTTSGVAWRFGPKPWTEAIQSLQTIFAKVCTDSGGSLV